MPMDILQKMPCLWDTFSNMASTGREQIGIENRAGEKKDVLNPVFKSLLAGLPVQHVCLVILRRLS